MDHLVLQRFAYCTFLYAFKLTKLAISHFQYKCSMRTLAAPAVQRCSASAYKFWLVLVCRLLRTLKPVVPWILNLF